MSLRLPTKYAFVEELPISFLETRFAEHRRLKLYCEKGTSCVRCGKDHRRLIKGKGRGKNNFHWDLYSDDLKSFITVGHIIPKSRGGEFKMKNLRPLCYNCNASDGNKFDFLLKETNLIPVVVGKKVKRKSGDKFQNGAEIVTISSVFQGKDSKVYFGFLDSERRFSYKANNCVFV